jgi:hypothetical protein
MYVIVNVSWIIFGAGVVAAGLCAWRYPGAVVPLTLAVATAAVLGALLHL